MRYTSIKMRQLYLEHDNINRGIGKDFKTCLIELKAATEAASISYPILIHDNAILPK